MTESESGSQTLHRVLALLDPFLYSDREQSFSDLEKLSPLPKATTHRLLKGLVVEGLLTVRNRRYTLGPKAEQIARAVFERDGHEATIALAAPHLAELRGSTGETVGIHCRVNTSRICIVELVSEHPIRMTAGVGHCRPIHAAAAGKVLLAWLNDDELLEILPAKKLPQVTSQTIESRDILLGELHDVRRRGYATSFGETVQGAAAIAAPIFGPNGEVASCINIAGPQERWGPAIEDHIQRLLEVTRLLSSEPAPNATTY